MAKHILAMALYQSIVVFVLIFAGEFFIPEPNEKLSMINGLADFQDELEGFRKECSDQEIEAALSFAKEGIIFPGRKIDWNLAPIYKCFHSELGASRHLTVVFTAFVYMQVFNMFNSRKIYDEINIFDGIHRNYYFISIMLIISGIQSVISNFGGDLFEVSRSGINGWQWGISLIVGVTVLFVEIFIKFIPDRFCPELGKKRSDQEDEKHRVHPMGEKKSSSYRKRISQRDRKSVV